MSVLPAPILVEARTGHSMAQGLARLGANVTLASLKSKRTPDEVVQKINNMGIEVRRVIRSRSGQFQCIDRRYGPRLPAGLQCAEGSGF